MPSLKLAAMIFVLLGTCCILWGVWPHPCSQVFYFGVDLNGIGLILYWGITLLERN